jgi:hypothetical protein
LEYISGYLFFDVLIACDGSEKTNGQDFLVDADGNGNGFVLAEDSDGDNASIHPNVEEICAVPC